MHESEDFLVGLFCGSLLTCSKMHTSLASLFCGSLLSGSKMQTLLLVFFVGPFGRVLVSFVDLFDMY